MSGSSDRDQLRARIRAALRSQSGDSGTDNTAAGDTSDRLNTDANNLDTSHFGEVPFDALRSLAQRVDGAAGNGSPLADLFSGFAEDTANRAAVTLLSGLTQGPVAIASNLANILSISQSRALTIARTELLGSYRDAQLANYAANSDVVGEWMWSADAATACIACIEMDGQTFPLDEDMIEHICGKCSPLPVTKGWDSILGPLGIDASDIEDTSITANYQSGHDWFLEQSDATQLSVLGPAKFSAWKSGDLSLGDLVGQRTDGAWGGSIYEKSLKELGLNARDYLPFSPSHFTGMGPQGGEAVQEARAAIPPPSLEPVRVELPGGGNMDAAARAGGWQSLDDVMAGLRGEATTAESAATAAAETNVAEEAAGVVPLKPFSVEPVPLADLQAEADRMQALVNANPIDVAGTKARIAQELANRLNDNPAFANADLSQKLVDNWVNGLREKGFLEKDIALAMQDQFPNGPHLAPEDITSALVHAWATGNGTLPVALQEAIQSEFGLSETFSRYSPDLIAAARAEWGDAQPAFQAFARAMYDNTQDWLREQGITEVTLYRGMAWADQPPAALTFDGEAHIVSMQLQAASSFTAYPREAALFANFPVMVEADQAAPYRLMAAARVPAENILSTAQSGFGAQHEVEFVVLGSEYDMRAIGRYVENTADKAEELSDVDAMNLLAQAPRE